VVRDVDDKIKSSTAWGAPTEGKETEFGGPVEAERNLSKEIRNRHAFAPDYADAELRFSLLEKSETKIRIKESHVTFNAPYVDKFEVWLLWDIVTPDPQSSQVVFRKSHHIEWFSKPIVWRIIRKAVITGIVEFNDQLPGFF